MILVDPRIYIFQHGSNSVNSHCHAYLGSTHLWGWVKRGMLTIIPSAMTNKGVVHHGESALALLPLMRRCWSQAPGTHLGLGLARIPTIWLWKFDQFLSKICPFLRVFCFPFSGYPHFQPPSPAHPTFSLATAAEPKQVDPYNFEALDHPRTCHWVILVSKPPIRGLHQVIPNIATVWCRQNCANIRAVHTSQKWINKC